MKKGYINQTGFSTLIAAESLELPTLKKLWQRKRTIPQKAEQAPRTMKSEIKLATKTSFPNW